MVRANPSKARLLERDAPLAELHHALDEVATGHGCLRAHVERLNAELAQVVDRLNQEDWHTTTTRETWPIGYAVRHIANGYAAVMQWVAAGRAGQPHHADPGAIHSGQRTVQEVLTTLLQARTRGHLDSIRATAAAEVSIT